MIAPGSISVPGLVGAMAATGVRQRRGAKKEDAAVDGGAARKPPRRLAHVGPGVGARALNAISAAVTATVLLAAFTDNPYTQTARKCITLMYPHEEGGETVYGTGYDDLYMAAFSFFALITLRSLLLSYVFTPLGIALGVPSGTAKVHKFGVRGVAVAGRRSRHPTPLSRQQINAWEFSFFATAWISGAYIYCTSPWYLNATALWTLAPHVYSSAALKTYCLVQLGYWVSMIPITALDVRSARGP